MFTGTITNFPGDAKISIGHDYIRLFPMILVCEQNNLWQKDCSFLVALQKCDGLSTLCNQSDQLLYLTMQSPHSFYGFKCFDTQFPTSLQFVCFICCIIYFFYSVNYIQGYFQHRITKTSKESKTYNHSLLLPSITINNTKH